VLRSEAPGCSTTKFSPSICEESPDLRLPPKSELIADPASPVCPQLPELGRLYGTKFKDHEVIQPDLGYAFLAQ
jgi:hypothetical protein